MSSVRKVLLLISLLTIGLMYFDSAWSDSEVVNLGHKVPSVEQIKSGLFPEDACKTLRENGYKCMGFKPAVRFSIPSENFKVGSAELPAGLKNQLDVFAKVLAAREDASEPVLITGHADASGPETFNLYLSKMRAQSVKKYLESKGVSKNMLRTLGKGDQDLADASHPYSGVNRRVEIGRLP